MAKLPKQQKVIATFQTAMRVEIRAPEFEPLSSLSALDTKKLSRGKHKIEIGFVKGGCCRNLVRAVVKNGMVIGCEVEPCEGTSAKPPPAELRSVLAKARKKITRGKDWEPVPVEELIRSSARMIDLIVIVGGGCFFICAWNFCFMCCWWPRPHCFIPDIVVGPL